MSTYIKHQDLVHDLDEAIAFINEHRHEFPTPKIYIDADVGYVATTRGRGSVEVSIEGYVR